MSTKDEKSRNALAEDPHFEREAAKYDRPIPSREFILEVMRRRGELMKFEHLAEALGLEDEEELEGLRRRLRAMERDGQIIRNRRQGYGLAEKMDLVRGRVIGHRDGFGFLVPDEGGGDLFLSPRQMKSLLHGDRVLAQVTGVDRRGRREGAVVEVLERANQQVVGRFFLEGGIGFVEPSNRRLNQDIVVPPEERAGAQHGQIVTVEITQQPALHQHPLGRVVEVVGDHMAPGMETDIAIRAHDLRHEWPDEVLAAAEALGDRIPEDAIAGRTDLRETPLVTIDGADARDFDDAVFCEPHDKGWRLLVAIADVSHYVQPGGPLDQEARERATSVYFPQQVIPMLPEALSNGLCSLNPQVDRLCMVCEMHLGPRGKLENHRFYEGVMRSAARFTYEQVAAILDGDKALREQYAALVPHLEDLRGLYRALAGARRRRGAIDFETDEPLFLFTEERRIERVERKERNIAHKIIEECMISANVAAAQFLEKHRLPALYRVHPRPEPDKLAELRTFLSELGLELKGGDEPSSKDFSELMAQVADRPDREMIQSVMLRSMQQAVYSPDNIGHFGLALKSYTHFTSPIRRYPDLVVHRGLRHLIAQRKGTWVHGEEDLAALGEHCSNSERRADEATRDAVDWLKCEFMQDKVGEEFEGTITNVTGFGIFVMLKENYIEGLVHITALQNDYFHFDPVKHRLQGERTGIIYRLADEVRVRCMRVDLDERKIDFELVEGGQRPRQSRQRRRRQRR